MCAAHGAGPVVTFARLVDELTVDERREVGAQVVAESRRRLATDLPAAAVRREQAVITVVSALCGLAP
jgi:hypothetical protein